MTKFKYTIIAAISLLFTISSCTKNEDIIRTLEVSEKTLVFNEKFQTKIVNVTADKGVAYTATLEGEGVAWVSTTVNALEGIVSITVAQNNDLSLRKAFVVVALADGTRNRVIEITQNGNDPILSIIPDEIPFEFIGGNFIAQVDSDAKWTVQNDVEWLEATSRVQSGELLLKAKENFDTFKLSTTLVVTAGKSSKEVVVIQDPAPSLIFPYLSVKGATGNIVMAFEAARYSTCTSAQGGRAVTATTKSRLMPTIFYSSISGGRTSVVSCKIDDTTMPDFFRSEDGKDLGRMHDFLMENGFVYLFKGLAPVSGTEVEQYWLEMEPDPDPKAISYDFLVSVDKTNATVRFDAASAKPDDTSAPYPPTLSAIPYPALPWGASMADVKIWEAANGGTMFDEDANGVAYTVSGDIYFKRFYLFTDDKLNDVLFMLNDYKRFALRTYIKGTYFVNPLFQELIVADGFIQPSPYQLIFTNESKNYRMGMNLAQEVIEEVVLDPWYGVLHFIPLRPTP